MLWGGSRGVGDPQIRPLFLDQKRGARGFGTVLGQRRRGIEVVKNHKLSNSTMSNIIVRNLRLCHHFLRQVKICTLVPRLISISPCWDLFNNHCLCVDRHERIKQLEHLWRSPAPRGPHRKPIMIFVDVDYLRRPPVFTGGPFNLSKYRIRRFPRGAIFVFNMHTQRYQKYNG